MEYPYFNGDSEAKNGAFKEHRNTCISNIIATDIWCSDRNKQPTLDRLLLFMQPSTESAVSHLQMTLYFISDKYTHPHICQIRNLY